MKRFDMDRALKIGYYNDSIILSFVERQPQFLNTGRAPVGDIMMHIISYNSSINSYRDHTKHLGWNGGVVVKGPIYITLGLQVRIPGRSRDLKISSTFLRKPFK
jgi:hypothetical protein